MSWLAFSDSFQYLCYGSTAIINANIYDKRNLFMLRSDT